MITQNTVWGCDGSSTQGLAACRSGRAAYAPSRSAPAKPMPRAPELSRSRILTVYTISFGLWFTGAVWLIAHYVAGL